MCELMKRFSSIGFCGHDSRLLLIVFLKPREDPCCVRAYLSITDEVVSM